MTRARIAEGLMLIVMGLANSDNLAEPPEGWEPHEWAYVRGLASGEILRRRMMLERADEFEFGSAMTTAADVEAWRDGAILELGDASAPVCQMFFHFRPNLLTDEDDVLACDWSADGLLLLRFGARLLPVPVRAGAPVITPAGDLEAFGATPITGDVWALSPSLNVPGALHGFVVLYGVPTPAPWEQLIVLAAS